MGQTAISDHLGPISSRLKSPEYQMIKYFLERFLSVNFQFYGNLITSKLTRSAPGGWISKFDSPFDVPRYFPALYDWLTPCDTLRSVRNIFSENGRKMWEFHFKSGCFCEKKSQGRSFVWELPKHILRTSLRDGNLKFEWNFFEISVSTNSPLQLERFGRLRLAICEMEIITFPWP